MDELIKMLNSCYNNEISLIITMKISGFTMYSNFPIDNLRIETAAITIISGDNIIHIDRSSNITYDEFEDEFCIDKKIYICGT